MKIENWISYQCYGAQFMGNNKNNTPSRFQSSSYEGV